jgi:uncharacterized NAD(P)/FAD-binding protein YdhS
VDRQRIVIIGGGFSGAALALELAATERAQVSVVDRFGSFGRGLAYSTTDPAHLLNVHAERMSVLADAPDDFWRWLHEQGHMAPRDAYAPRAAFGDYLAQRMRITTQFAEQGVLDLVRAEAVSCALTDARARVALNSGATLDADHVVLAIGNLSAAAPFDARALDAQRYIHNPWEPTALSTIGAHEDVLLVGAGLTMFDIALSLSPSPRSGKIHALSRRGLLPRAQADFVGDLTTPIALPLQLSEALACLRREAAATQARGEPWQNVMNRLRADTQTLWRRLPLETQRRFLRHARVWWDIHRHRASPYASAEIDKLHASGELLTHAGRIVRAEPTEGGVRVSVRKRGATSDTVLQVHRIINCTGSSADVAHSDEALIQHLLANGLARAHPTGLGFDVSDTSALIGADGVAQDRLSAIGPPTQGAFWEITAVPEIRRRASELAASIMSGR